MYLLYTIVLHFICWLIHFFRSKIALYSSVPICSLKKTEASLVRFSFVKKSRGVFCPLHRFKFFILLIKKQLQLQLSYEKMYSLNNAFINLRL